MNKIEPNMYVRTLFGIKKIDHIDNKKTVWKYLYKINDDNEFYALSDNDVIKASYNIIDLIEVGDYVNGEKVIRIYEKGECYDGSNYGLITKTIETENDNYETIPHDHLYVGYSIKSIVTKEQFKSMEYRLGE